MATSFQVPTLRGCVSRRRSSHAGSPSAWAIVARIDSTSNGSNLAASSSTSSTSDDLSEAITGAPETIASATGRPYPSYSDGKTNSSAHP